VEPRELRRYAAPAAFLVAATIAVVLIRAGFESGSDSSSATRTLPPVTHHHVVTTTTTTKAKHRKHAAAAAQYWTVQAGDTFGVISSKTGVPVATIEQLNPNVSSTTLTIGEKIRIR
jgi:LysM repeat protein